MYNCSFILFFSWILRLIKGKVRVTYILSQLCNQTCYDINQLWYVSCSQHLRVSQQMQSNEEKLDEKWNKGKGTNGRINITNLSSSSPPLSHFATSFSSWILTASILPPARKRVSIVNGWRPKQWKDSTIQSLISIQDHTIAGAGHLRLWRFLPCQTVFPERTFLGQKPPR